jgi:tetratricopeptide (TPR) repeat protein/TolB-like protein
MASIFLSYAHEDRRCAEMLARVLESDGHSVWWDRHLDGGEEFSAEIEAALDQCDVVVVAWSTESVKSRWVRDEATVGCDSGRLVPVSIDGSPPPMGFRQFHTLDLIDWKAAKRDPRTAELLRSVEQRLKGKKVALREPTSPPSKQRFIWASIRPLWAMAAVALVIAAAIALFVTNFQQSSGQQKPTFALLPFNTTSPDPKLRDLAAQTRASIAHTFSQSGLPVRLLSSIPQDRLVADFLIGGDFSRIGDKVQATIRLDEAAHGVTVYSTQFEAAPEDTPNMPERIGVQFAGTFNWRFPMAVLDRRHPLDPPLVADLLSRKDDTLEEYQVRKRVADEFPNVAVAQIGVGFYTSFVLGQLPKSERVEAVTEARRAVDRALNLDPDFAETYATWCLLHSEVRLIECEDRLRAGRRIDPDTTTLNRHLGWLLRNVGRFDEATELMSLSRAHDPYNSGRIRDMLQMLEYNGDSAGARELYRKAVRWFPDDQIDFAHALIFGLIDRGNFDARRVEQEIGPGGLPQEYLKSSLFLSALNAKSIPAAKRICAPVKDFFLNVIRCMLLFSSLGDQDDAYAIADKIYPRRVGRTPAETERIWINDPDAAGPRSFITSPGAAPMRRDPRYLQLAQRVGLLDYWRSGRPPPDFCRKQPEPICARLLNGKR